ncbi:MAG: DUF255 domain-containing protein [Nitrospirales bacterium]
MASRFSDNFSPSRSTPLTVVPKVVFILGLTISVVIFGVHTALSHQGEPDHQLGLQWHDWGQEAFARAQAEDKLILLDLTAVWCHACHVMDQTTYADPTVMALLQANFIAIRVDTDQRPDLESRYRTGGWPTTSLLLPTGEILFQANSLEPELMAELLQEARLLYESEKEDLRQQAATLWDRVKKRVPKEEPPTGAIRLSMASHSVEMIKKEFDPVNGGFRDHPKFFEPEAIQMALTYGFFESDVELINMGLTTLEKQVALLDPVWGGFYRYAEQADWSHPHFEKMLTIQAQNLHNYVSAYQLTGNREFKHIAWRIIDYVERFLTDPSTGQFFESQDADVRDAEGVTVVSGSDYFSWDMIHRKANGIPVVDRKIYTGSNADMAWAFLHAAQALGKTELKERALKVLQRIVEERFDETKGLAHGTRDDSLQLYGLLSDHIRLGLALVEAFRVTEDLTYLQQAEALARVNERLLEDTQVGGFFDLPPSSKNLGLLNFPTKPARENIQAVRWYGYLFHLTGKDEYRSTAKRTLQWIVGTPQPLPIALIGLAVDEWFRAPVHIAVVGMPGDGVTQDLWKAGQQLYCPRKMMKMFHPQRDSLKWGKIAFPYEGRPAAFICTDQLCLAPLYEAEGMAERLGDLFSILK